MFDRLPTEIIHIVIAHAVLELRISHWTSIVHLAQTCKAIHAVTMPLLYHAIALEKVPRNLTRLLDDPESRDSVQHMFSHTRELFVFESWRDDRVAALFRNAESITAPPDFIAFIVRVIDGIAKAEGTTESPKASHRVRHLHFWRNTYANLITVDHDSRLVTHVCAYAPDPGHQADWWLLLRNPANYMHNIISRFPAMTHLGFNLYYTEGAEQDLQQYTPAPFMQVLATALQHSQLQVIAIRVAGSYNSRWEEVLAALLSVKDVGSRLRVWKDTKRIKLWSYRLQEDMFAGTSIWTEAVPLRLFDTAKPV